VTDPTIMRTLVLFTAATALLFAAAHDVAVRTVPNRASLIVALAGVGLSALDGQLVQALFGAVLVFGGTWYCWRRGWIGGGDVKLLTACVLLVPPTSVPGLILGTAIAGGVLALAYLGLARLPPGRVTRRAPARRVHLLRRVWRAERWRIRRGLSLPYACAIAAGVLLTFCVPFG
jgi:prepilin peptidase CpaA